MQEIMKQPPVKAVKRGVHIRTISPICQLPDDYSSHKVKRASSELPGPLQANKKQRPNEFEREGTAVSSQIERNGNNRAPSAQLYDEGYAAPREFDDQPGGFQGNDFDDFGTLFCIMSSSMSLL